jgi:O-antigen ligase
MLISWSLVALKTAWSGYQFSLALVVFVAEPVVVRLSTMVAVPLAGAVDVEAVAERTGSSTHFSWSNVTAT